MAPFPHPAHRTGQADFLHPALGQDFTLSRATPSAASEQFSELIGFPISRSFTTYCVCLELRSLPSTGVARLQRYCEPLRHPKAPDLSLAGVRLIIADHAMGLPVLRMRTLSLYTCRRHYPCAASERIASLISSRRISLPRKGCRVDLRIVLFEACSAFTRVTACILALSPIRDTLIEGFSHFVTSMTAPIASGWSDCRVGLTPTGKRRLCTAHANNGHSWGTPFTNLNIERLFANSPVRHSRFAHALGNPRTLCETGRIVRWRTGVEVGEREIGIESEPRLYRSPRLLHLVEMSQRCGKIE